MGGEGGGQVKFRGEREGEEMKKTREGGEEDKERKT